MTPWLEVDKEIKKSVSEHTWGNLSDWQVWRLKSTLLRIGENGKCVEKKEVVESYMYSVLQ